MSVEKNVPEIRFKGFSGEWDDSEFSRIATRVSTQHQTRCLPCVEYEDIVAGKGRFNKDIHQKKIFKSGLKFEANDVLFGKLRPYLKNWFLADFEGIAVGDFWVLRADNVASTFLFSLIQTNKFEFIANLSAGSKMPRSDWGLVSSSCFLVPKSISESDKIGSTFQKLDNLIDQHQKKHNKLSSIKKAMLAKMFPKQGETIPEIRFKGFSGEWMEVQFKSIAGVRRGLTYKPDDIAENGIIVLRSSNINVDRFELRKDDVQVNKNAVNINRVKNGDILITSANGSSNLVGKHVVVCGLTVDAVHGGFMLLAETDVPHFLNASMNTYWYDRFRSMNVSGGNGAIGNIKGSALEEEYLYIPKKEEQIAIGNYFQKLDALINQHQQQITKLNNIKQACLSKMFV